MEQHPNPAWAEKNPLGTGCTTWVFIDKKNHGWRLVAIDNPTIIEALQWQRKPHKHSEGASGSYTTGMIRFKHKMTNKAVRKLVDDKQIYWSKFTGKIMRDQNHPGRHDQRLSEINQEGDFHAKYNHQDK